ncbi:hypothetical protein ACFL6N_02505 [Thermodesulfobacteriota bacterium]
MKRTNYSTNSSGVTVGFGKSPRLWDKSVIFFANIDCIFFGDSEKTRAIIDNVAGFHGYGNRLIPVLGLLFRGNDNVLMVQEAPNKALLVFYSQVLGLKLPEIKVVEMPPECVPGRIGYHPGLKEYILDHPADTMDGFVTDPDMEVVAANLGKELINSHQACKDANDKLLLNRFLKSAGLPRFDGGEAEFGKELHQRLDQLRAMGYQQAVVRASLGASGFGMHIIRLDETGAPFPHHLFPEGRVLVQGWIEEGVRGISRVSSPSVQFFCGDNGVQVFDLTDQLLSGRGVHEGNVSPPLSFSPDGMLQEELLRQTRLVTRWVADTGYRGTGSIDFLISTRADQTRIHVCEVNARVTGATYPSLLALHFNPQGAWLMRNILFEPCMSGEEMFSYFERKAILFKPGEEQGIIPLNIITDQNGMIEKSQLLFLSSTSEQAWDLMTDFPSLLPVECVYDRD